MKVSLKIILFLIIFSLSWIPLILPVIGIREFGSGDYSIYNTNWNGLSTFKNEVEKSGYKVRTILSSLSVLNRVTEPSILVIVGPTTFYDPVDSMALTDFLNKGGKVLIADDFGEANTLLLFAGLGFQFSGKLMLDAGSYDKNVCLPIIQSFESHPITTGVSSLMLNYPTAISGVSFTPLAYSTTSSWLDANNNYQYDSGEIVGRFPIAGYANVGNGTIVAVSDPSMFNNDMIQRADNLRFALNIINWLSGGDTNFEVIFDEGHLGWFWGSPVFVFGEILKNINWISSHWLIAPIYPLVAVYLVRAWLPKYEVSKEEVEELEIPISTFYSTKMRVYKRVGTYNKAVSLLYRKLKRNLTLRLNLRSFDLDLVKERILLNPNVEKEEIDKIFTTLEEINKGKKIVLTEEEFLKIFFEINKIEKILAVT
ncbi:MAG: DUF4350 domain-containing protein [Candidatus Odinarchaeia archaeon]